MKSTIIFPLAAHSLLASAGGADFASSGPGQEYMPDFYTASHHPNKTTTVPFKVYDQEWKFRVNVTSMLTKNIGDTSFDRPFQVNTVYDIQWPDGKSLNDSIKALQPKVNPDSGADTTTRLCAFTWELPFPRNVTNAFKQGDSCESALGSDCVDALKDAYKEATFAGDHGCQADVNMDNPPPACQGNGDLSGQYPYSQNLISAGNNISHNKPPAFPLRSGSGFYFTTSAPYEEGDDTFFNTEVEKMHMTIFTTGQEVYPVCARINNDKVKDGGSGVANSSDSSDDDDDTSSAPSVRVTWAGSLVILGTLVAGTVI